MKVIKILEYSTRTGKGKYELDGTAIEFKYTALVDGLIPAGEKAILTDTGSISKYTSTWDKIKNIFKGQ